MSHVRYRLVRWDDQCLPVLEDGDGLVWFWGEDRLLPAGKTLETLEWTDLLRPTDASASAPTIGPVEVAAAETQQQAWEAALRTARLREGTACRKAEAA